jgi:hypothetical protein
MSKRKDPNSEDQGESTGTKHRRLALIGGAVALVVAIAVAAVLLSGGSDDDAPAVNPAITKQQNYHLAQYDAGVSSGWPQDASDEHVGGYLESAWHDPASTEVTFVIDSRDAAEAGPPMAAAELSRALAQYLPDYSERGMKWIRLGGRPAVRWAYNVAGEARLDYFFEECDTSLVVRGSTPPVAWEALAPFFRGMATVITANCD